MQKPGDPGERHAHSAAVQYCNPHPVDVEPQVFGRRNHATSFNLVPPRLDQKGDAAKGAGVEARSGCHCLLGSQPEFGFGRACHYMDMGWLARIALV